MAVVLFLSVILIRSFLTGVIGAEPLSAHSAARFGGAPGNTKAMLAAPQDRAVGYSFGGFFSVERWGSCRSIRESSAPFGGVVLLIPWGGRSWHSYLSRTVI